MQQTFTASDYGGIVLSAGGLKGFYELGVLQYYHVQGYLNQAKVFAGTSIGSFLAALYSSGFDPLDILKIFLEIKVILPEDADWGNITRDYGIYSTNRLKKWMEYIFREKFGYVPTLLELFQKTNKHLILCAYNVTKTRIEYFTWKTEPDMTIVDAIIASCTIPLMFKPFHYKGSLYVDGARGEVCPLEYTRNYMTNYTNHRLLCVAFDEREPKSFTEFMNNVVVNFNVKKDELDKYRDFADIVFLQNEWVPFDVAREQKMNMFDAGLKFITELAEKQQTEISLVMPSAENLAEKNKKDLKKRA